jgi:SAM-dependent methyltransferase
LAEDPTCPSCGSQEVSVFYELEAVPVNSVVLLRTREEALSYPKGDIRLALCSSCGFITNVAFDPSLLEYSDRYEATQSFSPTFSAFAQRLAARLVDQYDLHGKDIIEIGCGQGEFLTLLCELGGNRGVGFDPAYVGTRRESEAADRLTFIADFYDERYAHYRADLICCKMTLEHIHETAAFVRTIRRALGDQADTVVFFQVPDVRRILDEVAFWDIYYEHCSYFSAGSLARLFRSCGFDVLRVSRDYGGQYLLLEARLRNGAVSKVLQAEEDLPRLGQEVQSFAEQCRSALPEWKRLIEDAQQGGRKVTLWGGGSKAVAFLTTLGVGDEIRYAVDINPRKHGTYLPGTGQEIVAPAFLIEYRPDLVLVMNPIYRKEVEQELRELGLNPQLVDVGRRPWSPRLP